MKPEFCIDNYPLTDVSIAMHCRTEDQANVFCDYLAAIGKTWVNGNSYRGNTRYRFYGENTIYYFLEGLYGNVSYAEEHGHCVLEFGSFNWTKFKYKNTDEWEDVDYETAILF